MDSSGLVYVPVEEIYDSVNSWNNRATIIFPRLIIYPLELLIEYSLFVQIYILFLVHVTVHREKSLQQNQLNALISQIYFGIKLYMFRTVPLSIIRSYSLYTQQWYMSYMFVDCFSSSRIRMELPFLPDPATQKLSTNLCDIYHCCVYSEKLLLMDRRTVRNMWSK
jgi:hypothetical protein